SAPAVKAPDIGLGMPSGVVEPIISLNPNEPGQIAASSQNRIRTTADDGHTFSAATVYPISSDGDTASVFDSQGRLFWSNLNFATNGIDILQLDPTTGAVIAGPFQVTAPNDPSIFDDKQFLAADPVDNTLYIVWERFSNFGTQVMLTSSSDHGHTWSTPVPVSPNPAASTEGFVWPATVSVAPNHDVYVAYHSQPGFDVNFINPDGTSGQTLVMRSTNHGASFDQKVLAFGPGQSDITFNVQDAPATRTIPNSDFWTQGSVQPWVLADPSRPGNIYVVAADDATNGGTGDVADVVFARSTDNGRTWTRSTLESGPNNSLQLFPNASIDKSGNIIEPWTDTRRGLTDSIGHFELDVFAKYSADGGVTWSPAFQINDPANPLDPDAPGSAQRFPGPPPTYRIGEYFGSTLF